MGGASFSLGSMVEQATLIQGLGGPEPGSTGSAIQVIASLAVVLGLLLVGLAWSRRFLNRRGGRSQGAMLRVLGGVCIGLKKNICLVEVPGSILVVGVSQDAISLLATIASKEELEMIRQTKDAEPEPLPSGRRSPCTVPLSGEENGSDSRQFFAFMKGKLPSLSSVRRMRPRLYPVLVSKHEQE